MQHTMAKRRNTLKTKRKQKKKIIYTYCGSPGMQPRPCERSPAGGYHNATNMIVANHTLSRIISYTL